MTVEPVLNERPSDRKKNEVILSDQSDGVDDKKLRLKGTILFSKAASILLNVY